MRGDISMTNVTNLFGLLLLWLLWNSVIIQSSVINSTDSFMAKTRYAYLLFIVCIISKECQYWQQRWANRSIARLLTYMVCLAYLLVWANSTHQQTKKTGQIAYVLHAWEFIVRTIHFIFHETMIWFIRKPKEFNYFLQICCFFFHPFCTWKRKEAQEAPPSIENANSHLKWSPIKYMQKIIKMLSKLF